MKKTITTSLIAAAAAILSLASPAQAGVLILDDNNPVFTPPEAFVNNTIQADSTIGQGALIHITGSTTVDPTASTMPSIAVSGTYSALAGDIFSIAYKFSADLNTTAPVGYTLTVSLDGVPLPPITGTLTPGLHVYEGTAQSPIPFPADQSGVFNGTLTLDFGSGGAPNAAAPGTLDLTVQQIDFKLDPIPAIIAPPALSQNISTRANVGVDTHVLIGGFIVTGNDPKMVVLRALGPSLGVSGVTGVLTDPTLELHDSSGAVIATNDNWMDLSADDQMTLTDHLLAPTEDSESAIVATLDPGLYTAVVSGVGDTTGVALVEAYDIDDGTTDSSFGNISTRGFVETGENVMIGGFILGGGGGGLTTVVVRAIGPSLADAGIVDPLADPVLELRNGDGDLVDSNDNWMDDPNMQQVADAGLAPSDPNESALYKILPAGNYTATVSGAGDTSGVALVESYNLDSNPAPVVH